MNWVTDLVSALRRYRILGGFWDSRTTFYRDTANAIEGEGRELFGSFVEGELAISQQPKTADKPRAKGLLYTLQVIRSGDFNLHQILTAVMPKGDALSLVTLQSSKNVSKTLRELAVNIDNQREMTKVVRIAMFSPLMIIGVAYAFAYMYASMIIPNFVKAAPDEVWEIFFNRMVRFTSGFINDWGPWLAMLTIGSLVWAALYGLPKLTADWRYKMESSKGLARAGWILIFPLQPLFAIYRDIQGVNMLGNLANLMQSGALLTDALDTLASHAQPWMRKHLMKIKNHINTFDGDHVGAFSHGVLPKFLLGRMGTLVRREGGGKFASVLVQLGSLGVVESRESVKKSAATVSVILSALALGVVVFFFVGQGVIVGSIKEANSPTALAKRQAKKMQQSRIAVPTPAVSSPSSP